MKRPLPCVSPEVAAVVLAADRLMDVELARLVEWWMNPETDSPELAALRRAVLALRKKREEEIKAVGA